MMPGRNPSRASRGDPSSGYLRSGLPFNRFGRGGPNGRLALYEGMGHPASGSGFERDVLDFLLAEEGPAVGAGPE
jgi:hypothetical protein